VVFAERVTLQLALFDDVQPVQEENEFPPALAGAVSVTEAPAAYARAKLVEPVVAPVMSGCETPIDTPLTGFVELTVSV
jgi:hypothetical protein